MKTFFLLLLVLIFFGCSKYSISFWAYRNVVRNGYANEEAINEFLIASDNLLGNKTENGKINSKKLKTNLYGKYNWRKKQKEKSKDCKIIAKLRIKKVSKEFGMGMGYSYNGTEKRKNQFPDSVLSTCIKYSYKIKTTCTKNGIAAKLYDKGFFMDGCKN